MINQNDAESKVKLILQTDAMIRSAVQMYWMTCTINVENRVRIREECNRMLQRALDDAESDLHQ